MTPEPPNDRPDDAGADVPRRLDYLSVPPIAPPALTLGQRIVLAVFMLFPVLLLVLYMLAALSEP